MVKINKTSHDPYLLGLFLILLFLSIFVWRFGTNLAFGFADSAYHLSVAEGFSRAGGITIWDFWNSLPIGRPHSYPPLFHLVLADLLKIGMRPEIALKIMIELSIVGGMAVFASGIIKLFNSRVAFWSAIFLVISIQFLKVSATVMPATIVIFLIPLLFYYFREQKWISYIVILTVMLYLHLFLPFLILLALAIYAIIFERNRFWATLKATSFALLLYSPWLIHIFLGGFKYIKYFDSSYQIDRYQNFPQTNLILLALAIISLIFLIIKRKFNKETYFILIISILFAVMSFFSTDRFLNGHLLIYFSLFIALFFDRFLLKVRFFIYLIPLVIVFCLFKTPELAFSNKFNVHFSQPTFLQTVFQNGIEAKSEEQIYNKLFTDMRKNSKEGESVGTALKYFDNRVLNPKDYQSNIAIFLSANANRPTINLYQPEYAFRALPDLSNARLVLLNASVNALTPQYFYDFDYSHQKSDEITKSIKKDFVLIGQYKPEIDTGSSDHSIYLYKNSATNITIEKVPKFVFPLWLANLIIAGLILLIIKDEFSTTKKSHNY